MVRVVRIRAMLGWSDGQLKAGSQQNLRDNLKRLATRVHLESGEPGSVDAEMLGIRPLAHSLLVACAPNGVPNLRGVHVLTMPRLVAAGRGTRWDCGQPGEQGTRCG